MICDPTKARKILGWHLKNSLKAGIDKTIVWMKSREEIL
jgi:nucleoside-diphosphate-sugar epimerase